MAVSDYWKVNSYGYPNPFGDKKAADAYSTLSSFFEVSSYEKLKKFWGSRRAPRLLRRHAVESWKATFEEFGLLYVISGDDHIRITPAGEQFKAAGDGGRERDFAWIGLSLLLRYPLRGARYPKGPRHMGSDLLPYWFLFAAMRELGNELWWSELERVLCRVFSVEEAAAAVERVRDLRAGRTSPESFPLPVVNRKGAFYNNLNQLIVHAGMGYLLLGKSTDESLYSGDATERRHWIREDAVSLVDLALGGAKPAGGCGTPDGATHFVARMPAAPSFGSEQEYFDYLGAAVPAIPTAQPLPEIAFEGGVVAVLRDASEYEIVDPFTVRGQVARLCKLAKGQRLILSHDLGRTYILQEKKRESASTLLLRVSRAKPITNPTPILDLLEAADD